MAGLSKGKLVAGPLGDISLDFHGLLRVFAEARVASAGRASGVEHGPGQLGLVMGKIRRSASVTVVRSQAVCLLEHLAFLGPGARQTAQRRQTTLRLEQRRRKEVQAYQLALAGRGRGEWAKLLSPKL